MNIKKILLGTAAGTVALFLTGFLIYGLLLENFMKENFNTCIMRPMEETIWGALILANVAGAMLLALIFSFSNTEGFKSGAKIGSVIGLFFGIYQLMGLYAVTTLYLNVTAVFVDIIAYTIMAGIPGGVIGWAMGMYKKEA